MMVAASRSPSRSSVIVGEVIDAHLNQTAERSPGQPGPSYTNGARYLDILIQDRRAAVAVARSLSNRDYRRPRVSN